MEKVRVVAEPIQLSTVKRDEAYAVGLDPVCRTPERLESEPLEGEPICRRGCVSLLEKFQGWGQTAAQPRNGVRIKCQSRKN